MCLFVLDCIFVPEVSGLRYGIHGVCSLSWTSLRYRSRISGFHNVLGDSPRLNNFVVSFDTGIYSSHEPASASFTRGLHIQTRFPPGNWHTLPCASLWSQVRQRKSLTSLCAVDPYHLDKHDYRHRHRHYCESSHSYPLNTPVDCGLERKEQKVDEEAASTVVEKPNST
jgi:hypothetical protein